MTKVNMLEAKTNLSKLVEAVESGRESEIVIARNGKPVARIVAIEQEDRKLGLAEGEFTFDYEGFQAADKDIQEVLDRRWKRFERHSAELDKKYGKKARSE
jgi:prevent-host-death family protein